jgi:hypothetical protein
LGQLQLKQPLDLIFHELVLRSDTSPEQFLNLGLFLEFCISELLQ